MKIIREITYEGTEEQLRRQLERSMRDGENRPGVVTITVRTVYSDVADLNAGSRGWYEPRMEAEVTGSLSEKMLAEFHESLNDLPHQP
jgi:hypothetical protein